MPQLDKVTFISQLFWLILFFGLLFIYVNFYLVPTVAKNLKYRKRLLSNVQTNVVFLEKKQHGVLVTFDSDVLSLIRILIQSFKTDVLEQEILLKNKLFVTDMAKTISVVETFNSYKYNNEIYNLRKGCI